MFSVEERGVIQHRVLELARRDPTVVAAALTGSHATDDADRWSDLDLAFAIRGPVDAAMHRWTRRMYEDFAATSQRLRQGRSPAAGRPDFGSTTLYRRCPPSTDVRQSSAN